MSRILVVLGQTLFVALLFMPRAHAYIDPGTGSMLLQAIAATGVAALIFGKRVYSAIVSAFSKDSCHPGNDASEMKRDEQKWRASFHLSNIESATTGFGMEARAAMAIGVGVNLAEKVIGISKITVPHDIWYRISDQKIRLHARACGCVDNTVFSLMPAIQKTYSSGSGVVWKSFVLSSITVPSFVFAPSCSGNTRKGLATIFAWQTLFHYNYIRLDIVV